jgi:hypothetical protein
MSVYLTYVNSNGENFCIFNDFVISLSTLSSFFLLSFFLSLINISVYFLKFETTLFSFNYQISPNFIYTISPSSLLYFLLFFVKVLRHPHFLLSNLFFFMCTFDYLVNSGLFKFLVIFLILSNFIQCNKFYFFFFHF